MEAPAILPLTSCDAPVPTLEVLESTRRLRLTRPGDFPPWLGPALRGLVAWRFKEMVCRQPPAERRERWKTCVGCPHMADCPYGRTFEPDPPPGAAVFRGQENAARPLVLSAPFPTPGGVGAGWSFPLTILFIGNAAASDVEAVWRAVEAAGADVRSGLDPAQTTFRVEGGSHARRDAVQVPLTVGDPTECVPAIRVELTAPLILRQTGPNGRRHVERPSFADLLRASLRTLGQLFALYAGPLPAAFGDLRLAAEAVPCRSSAFRTFRQPRWSNRTQQHRDVYGVVGEGVYGPVPRGLLPWLEWGGRLHVGVERVAGAGGSRVLVE